MAAASFHCPVCNATYAFREELAGRKLKCKACGAAFTVEGVPPGRAAGDGSQRAAAWHAAQDEQKRCRQVILDFPPGSEVAPRVGNLVTIPQFMVSPWAATTLRLDGPDRGPFIFIRAEGAVEKFRGCRVCLAFSFYRMEGGAILTILIHVRCDELESRTGKPAVFENHLRLDDDEQRQLADALLRRENVEICFTASGPNGPCTGYFGIAAPLPADCRDRLRAEWDDLCQYHESIPLWRQSFQQCMAQYERENPVEENPILGDPFSPRARAPGQGTETEPAPEGNPRLVEQLKVLRPQLMETESKLRGIRWGIVLFVAGTLGTFGVFLSDLSRWWAAVPIVVLILGYDIVDRRKGKALAMPALFTFLFVLWTTFLLRNGFTWWSLAPGLLALSFANDTRKAILDHRRERQEKPAACGS